MMLLKKCNGRKAQSFAWVCGKFGGRGIGGSMRGKSWDVFWQGRPEDMRGFIDYCIHAIVDEYRGILLIYPVLFVPLYFSYN